MNAMQKTRNRLKKEAAKFVKLDANKATHYFYAKELRVENHILHPALAVRITFEYMPLHEVEEILIHYR